MLRLIGILVTILYMTVTSGIVINIHYCMGEVEQVAVGGGVPDSCGSCGMDSDGCCHTDVEVVKLTDGHQASAAIAFPGSPAELNRHDAMDRRAEIPAKWVDASKAHTPPKVFDRNIHYRVFRI